MGERRREEGPKLPRDISRRNLGLHHGDEVGQSLSGLQGFSVGQSPRNHKGKAARSIDTFRLADQKTEYAGMLGEKAMGTVNPNLTNLQKTDTSRVEEEGCQKRRPTQNLGQRKDNNSKGGACRKVRRMSREVRGSQIDEKESSLYDSDRDLNYGKVPRDALLSVDSNIGGEEGDSSRGEKTLNPFPLPVGGSGRFNTELGREIKTCRIPNYREERSSTSKPEDEGDDISHAGRTVNAEAECLGKFAGTWPMSSSKAWRILQTHQEKEVLGPGQVSFTDRGSASGDGSTPELGRAQGRDLGSGRSNRTGPGPTPNISSSLHELGSCGPTCSEAMEKGVGLSQEMLLRSPL